MKQRKITFLRYPGGKSRLLYFLIPRLLPALEKANRLVEPFAGGCALFFALNPVKAILSDINPELIDLYKAIRLYPKEVWDIFKTFPPTREAYYKIRNKEYNKSDIHVSAARTLYLNRTCFKGMWRHNSKGKFNVGYGGQDRRWVLNENILIEVSQRLKNAEIKCSDFEDVIAECNENDYVFVDPPYRPHAREMIHNHYLHSKFSFKDHQRLAVALNTATQNNIHWSMTTSSHPDITQLFNGYRINEIPKGTGKKIGTSSVDSGELLIQNH